MPCLLVNMYIMHEIHGQSCDLPSVSLIRVLYSVIFHLLSKKYKSRGDTNPEQFYSASLPIQALLSIYTLYTVYEAIKDLYYVTHYFSLSYTLQHVKLSLFKPMKEQSEHSRPVSRSPLPPQTAKPEKIEKAVEEIMKLMSRRGLCINRRILIIFSYEVATLR